MLLEKQAISCDKIAVLHGKQAINCDKIAVLYGKQAISSGDWNCALWKASRQLALSFR